LGLALKIGGSKRITAASIGTDGTDGPTEIAGGIVDGYTLNRAEMMGIELYNELRRHNSSYVLRRLEDAIYTGSTGTNVMNLRVMIVN
jgi:glycerate-2-kinase